MDNGYQRHRETAHYPIDKLLGVPHPECERCQWYELQERLQWD